LPENRKLAKFHTISGKRSAPACRRPNCFSGSLKKLDQPLRAPVFRMTAVGEAPTLGLAFGP